MSDKYRYLPAALGAFVVLLLAFPPDASATCYRCATGTGPCENNNEVPFEYGWREPCLIEPQCPFPEEPENCTDQCFGQGGLCGPEALTMSGQVVLPLAPGTEAWERATSFLIRDAENGSYHRPCDGAMVLIRSPRSGSDEGGGALRVAFH